VRTEAATPSASTAVEVRPDRPWPEAARKHSSADRVIWPTLLQVRLSCTSLRIRFGTRQTRRRVKVIGRLPGERSCLSPVWAVLDRASLTWRGIDASVAGILRL